MEAIESMDSPMEQEQERWEITDDSTAEWALKKITEAKTDTEKWAAYYAAQLEKIRKANNGTVEYMEAALRTYFDKVPHHVTKTMEKYALPSGELVLKAQEPEWQHNDEALLPWCKQSGLTECVKIKESVSWSDLKKRLAVSGDKVVDKETGEVVEAVTCTARPPKFTVTIKG